MTAARVSVAIATYNRASMVCQAVQAAVTQTEPPVEVCVVDDASTDATWEVLSTMREPRLQIFRQPRNTGGVDNWNFAIEQTSGDYIAWCSDDDRFLPDHLEASVAYLNAHPEVGVVHSGFIDAVETESANQTMDRGLRFPTDRILTRNDLLPYLTCHYDWPFHPSTIVMRRTAWNKIGRFDPAYALADTDWFVRAVEQFPVAMLARHGVLNRRHSGNWSNRLGSARMHQDIFTIVESFIGRTFERRPFRRIGWRMIWRWNVRLRLLLTMQTRVARGHTDAACAAWFQIVTGTKLPLLKVLYRPVDWMIRKYTNRRPAHFQDARESVSPL